MMHCLKITGLNEMSIYKTVRIYSAVMLQLPNSFYPSGVCLLLKFHFSPSGKYIMEYKKTL